jgi:cleavage and polyadenylation specificity factor subunit 4
MMHILAPIENIRFDIEDALDNQTFATVPLPFQGIDSKLFSFFLPNKIFQQKIVFIESAAAICEFFMKSNCSKGNQCPFRHVKGKFLIK